MGHDRRSVLGMMAGGIAAAGLMSVACTREQSGSGDAVVDGGSGGEGWSRHGPLPYVKLDPVHVASLGYQSFYEGDCMYGVFGAIVAALAEQVGEPFTSFPTWVTRYGAGGVMGWGTLCGAANGAAMACFLVSKDPTPAINEVLAFYEREELPNVVPEGVSYNVPSSVAASNLCHVSISRWCDVSGLGAYSPERLDRCAQLVASVAKFTAEVLNAQSDGSFSPAHSLSEATIACLGCHGQGGALRNTRGKMACATCHSEGPVGHP